MRKLIEDARIEDLKAKLEALLPDLRMLVAWAEKWPRRTGIGTHGPRDLEDAERALALNGMRDRQDAALEYSISRVENDIKMGSREKESQTAGYGG